MWTHLKQQEWPFGILLKGKSGSRRSIVIYRNF